MALIRCGAGSTELNYHYYDHSEMTSLSNTITGINAKDMYVELYRGSTPTLTLNGVTVTAEDTEALSGSDQLAVYHLTDVKASDTLVATAWSARVFYI